jgi:radical SAM protein with 4Fe4S-binding SPASM domain
VRNLRIFKPIQIIPKIPRLLIQRQINFEFEKIPYRAEHIPVKKIVNFFVAGLNQYILPSRPLGRPVFAQVEPTNICNLSCPLCLNVAQVGGRAPSYLDYNTYQKFIDEVGDHLLLLVLWNWGEPFLHPDIFRMIADAKAHGIIVCSSTNGNVGFENEDTAKLLVESGLDSLVIAVDGATQDTYTYYRRGGNLNRVIEGIRTIIKVRDQMGSRTPLINMRFVAMRHNEHEIDQVRQLAQDLGVDYFTIKTVDLPVPANDNPDSEYVPTQESLRRYEYSGPDFIRKARPFDCMRPWKRITLDSGGRIIPCEYEYRSLYAFGNIRSGGSAIDSWKSIASSDFRRHFSHGNNEYYLCQKCTYKNIVQDDCTVMKMEIPKSIP